jgi:hypothetical protein
MATWYNKYAAITLSAATGIGAFEAVPWSTLSASDWGTWVGSIGTVGALVGTIWLATTESRSKRNEALMYARLHAAGMFWHLVHAQAAASSVSDALKNADIESVLKIRDYVQEVLSELTLWPVSDLVPLIPLKGNAASKLAQATDQVNLVRKYLGRTQRMTASEAMSHAATAVQMLEIASKLMMEAIDVFRAAAIALNRDESS